MAPVQSSKPCKVCGKPTAAREMCPKHYARWLRHGNTDKIKIRGPARDNPHYRQWCSLRKLPMEDIWRTNFWCFADDVGDPPSNNYTLRRVNLGLPFGPSNFYWKEKIIAQNIADYHRQWREQFPERSKQHQINRPRRNDAGLNPEEYKKMFESQNGLCKICYLPEQTMIKGKIKNLSADHCHDTGKQRELLCSNCNRAIGLLNESVAVLKSAIEYLEKHQGNQ